MVKKKCKKTLNFECCECGSHELGYQKYARCITPVTLKDDDHIEYGQSKIYEDDFIIQENAFVCMDCEGFVEHLGFRMETEQDLLAYLNIDPSVSDEQQAEYEQHMSAVAEEQELRDDVISEEHFSHEHQL